MKRKLFNRRDGERGQGFMELGISLVFLLVLLSAMVDLAWAFYTLIALRDAVQEAAAYGSMCPDRLDLVEIRLRQSASAPVDMNQISDFDIKYCNPGGTCRTNNPVRGDYLRVRVSYMHEIITPFVGAFINSQSYPLEVIVSDTIMRDKCPPITIP
jgi:Flp pilus assembly protein TadG